MPSLVVTSRSLRRTDGVKKCVVLKSHRSLELPSSGDAVAAILAALVVPKGSRVQLAVRRTRLLRAAELLDSLVEDDAGFVTYASQPARSAAAGEADEPVETLRLVAVPCGERCAPARLTGPRGLC
jgi:hypothetical protein